MTTTEALALCQKYGLHALRAQLLGSMRNGSTVLIAIAIEEIRKAVEEFDR